MKQLELTLVVTLIAAAIAGPANATLILSSDFVTDASANAGNSTTTGLVWTGDQSANASQLTAVIDSGGGFTNGTWSTDSDHDIDNTITINERMNDPISVAAGYRFTFTPDTSYFLETATMQMGAINGSGGTQGAADGHIRLWITGTGVNYSSESYTEQAVSGSGNTAIYGAAQDIDTITLAAGTTYTITAAFWESDFNGFFHAKTFDTNVAAFELTGTVVPEPSTLSLVGLTLAGLAVYRRRK